MRQEKTFFRVSGACSVQRLDLEIPKSFDSPRIIFAVQLAFAKLLSQSYHKAKLMSTIFKKNSVKIER